MTVGITELPPEGMQLGGVALAGDPERGTKTTEGLSLLFTTAGITVQGPQPQIERLLVWSGLDSAACSEKTVLPDGRNAGVMELTSGGQTIRFLLPTESVTPGQAAYLDQALPAWLKRYKETGSSPLPPPPAQVVTPAPQMPPPPVGAQPTNGTAGYATSPPTAPTAESAVAGGPPASPPPAARPEGPLPPPPARAATPPTQAGGQPKLVAPASPVAPPPPPPGMPTFAVEPPSHAEGPSSPPSGAGSTPQLVTNPVGPPLEGVGTPSTNPWDDPPLGEAGETALPTKRRGWRKSRNASPDAAADSAPLTVEGGPQPPAEPPGDPVPLVHSTLPAPTDEAPSVLEDRAAQSGAAAVPVVGPSAPPASTEGDISEESPAKTGWRRRGKLAAAGAGAATAGAALDHAEGDTSVEAPATPGPQSGSEPAPAEAARAGIAPSSGPEVAPTTIAHPPSAAGPSSDGPGRGPESVGVVPPADDVPPEEDQGEPGVPNLAPPSKNNRSMVVLLLVLLLVVIGGIAYFAVKKNNNTTTDNPLAPNPTVSPVAADSALAASINLRQSDLPSGWNPVPASGQVARPPVAPAAAQVAVERTLATCIGGSYPQAAGVFGGSVLPGQTDSVRSPTFQSGSDTSFQMASTTTVMSTAAQAQALTTSFANPNLATCLGQYQSSLVAAAMPGATAQVQMVTLPAPPGASVLGYITTLTLPNQGSEVIGQAFVVAGRVETRIEPTTSGEAVPGDVFTPAYNAVAARVATAANK
jgi:hypothetical protein